jgi:PRTase ComF-like
MAYFRFAAYELNSDSDLPFNPQEYSKFKFGDTDLAQSFAKQLAEKFLAQHAELLLENDEIVVISSPYNSIPTASYWLSYFFKREINKFLYEKNKNAAFDAKIHRYKTYSIDYGSLDFEARQELIATDTYHIDGAFLKDRLCIFLDDIKITGSHEYVIKRQLRVNEIENNGTFFFVYFAELKNMEIVPQFENTLNYAYVKGLSEIIEMMSKPSFRFNTRVIKYILSSEKIDSLLEKIHPTQLQELVDWAISNNYHKMEEYQLNIQKIIQSLRN